MKDLEKAILSCEKCKRLRSVSRTPWPHVYFGKPENLTIMIVMRNPGLENDPDKIGLDKFKETYLDLWLRCRVGKYLLETLGRKVVMQNMFFCNICKCSSPNNSALEKDEIANCMPYLQRQIEIIKPKVILSFGGEAHPVVQSVAGDIPVHTFLHPSYLWRMNNFKTTKQQADEINIIIKKYKI